MKKPFKLLVQLVAMVAFGILGFLFVKNWRKHKQEYPNRIKRAVANIRGRLHKPASGEETQQAATRIVPLSGLSPRQKQVYEIISAYKTVEMKDLLAQIKGVTERTLRRDLLKLQQEGLVAKKGTTKAVSYTKLK
jgi:hypothetical protein